MLDLADDLLMCVGGANWVPEFGSPVKVSPTNHTKPVCPSGIEAGDLLIHVWWVSESGDGYSLMSGWTEVTKIWSSGDGGGLAIKVADGTEDGTTVTNMASNADTDQMLIHIPANIGSVSGGINTAWTETSGNPSAQTLVLTGGTAPTFPALVLAFYGSSGSPTGRSFSGMSGYTDQEATDGEIAMRYLLVTDQTPANITIDMSDKGSANVLIISAVELGE